MSVQEYKSVLNITARAVDLAPTDRLTKKSDPYLVIKIPNQILGDHNISEDGKGDKKAKGWKKAVEYTGIAAHVAIAEVLAPVLLVVAVPIAVGFIGGKIIKHAAKNHTATPGFQEVYSSPVVKRELNPTWPTFQLAFHDVYVHSPESKLLFECWDYDKASASDFVGYCLLSVQDLLSNPAERQYQLVDRAGNPRGQLCLAVQQQNAPNQEAIATEVQHIQEDLELDQEVEQMSQYDAQNPLQNPEHSMGLQNGVADPNTQMERLNMEYQQGIQHPSGATAAGSQQQFDYAKHLTAQPKHPRMQKMKNKVRHRHGGGATM